MRLQCAGAFTGSVEIEALDTECSVATLRERVCACSGLDSQSVKIIAGGRTLEENSKTLEAYGVHARSKLLVIRTASADCHAQLVKQENRAQRLTRLKDAAASIAARGDGSQWNDDAYEFVLENQAGQGMQFVDAQDRRALVMGLALHEQGKQQLDKEDYQGALDVLLLAEEALDMVNPSLVERVDNVGLLMIDIVWCYFQLRAIGELAAASARLSKAQRSLDLSHGPSGSRMRHLHGNFCPELAIYVRLELLQGVAAFHSGDKLALKHLESAKAKWQRLQVSDESLAALASMGFSTHQATRALRFCEGNLDQAAAFAAEQAEAAQKRKRQHRAEKEMRKKMRRYGRTADGKLVDSAALQLLQNMGFDAPLVAEALKQTNNNGEAALDLLGDPARRDALQLAACLTSARQEPSQDNPSEVNGAEPSSSHKPASDAAALLAQALQSKTSGYCKSQPDGADTATAELQHATEHQGLQHDHETEDELAANLKDDPLSAYDVDVSMEGAAVEQYLMLMNDQEKSKRAS